MAKRNRYFNDPKFHQWLTEVLCKLTDGQKDCLNDTEALQLRDYDSVKRFVNHAPMEKIELILTKVGYAVNRSFYVKGKLAAETVKKAADQYNGNAFTKDQVIGEMMEADFFVITDRDIALSLSMMGFNCHSQSYNVNPSLRGAGRHINHVSKKFKEVSHDSQHKEAVESSKAVARLAFGAINMEGWIQFKFNLQLLDVSIMLLLYHHQGKWVSTTYLERLLPGYTKQSICRRAGRLHLEGHYVERMKEYAEVSKYTLTSKGILAIGDIIRYLIDKEFK